MLERLALAMQKKTIDNDQPTKKANDRTRTKLLEMRRIDSENKFILKRILDATPKYDHQKWEAEAKQRAVYVSNICEYPPPKQPDKFGITPVKWAENTPVTRPSTSGGGRGRRCMSAAPGRLESDHGTKVGVETLRPVSAKRTSQTHSHSRPLRPATAGTARKRHTLNI